jgi:hypothetical protein
MRRHLIGLLAFLLWLGAAWFWLWPPEGSAVAAQLESACWRMGALAAVIWVAYSDIHRMPRWLWSIFLLVLVAVALRPRLTVLAIPLIIALAILRPKWGARSKK